MAELILTGDINLMNVTDSAVPFALVGNEFRAADLVFGNLECCLCPPPKGHSADTEGFFADLFVAGAALTSAGVQAVGIAVVRGHTAYQIPMRGSRLPANRPGLPPQILTWADQQYLQRFTQEINVLRGKVDIVVASCHWGVGREVLQYMAELGHAAVDAGADLVIGHGPHYSLPVELYRGRPIFYGLGSFSFHTGHRGRIHGDWLGMMVRVSCEAGRIDRAAFRFVRHDDRNRTVPRVLADEGAAFDLIARESANLGTKLLAQGDEVAIVLGA